MKITGTLFIGVILAISAVCSGCRPSGGKPGGHVSPVRVTDFRNKEIALSAPATRIVCLIESALSGLYMLKAENNITGVPSDVYTENLFPWYAALDDRIKNKTLPAPGNWDFISIEKILAIQPDLVIIWSSQVEAIRMIEAHGIPVYAVFLESFEDVYKEIEDLGKMTGKSLRADSLIAFTKAEINRITERQEAGKEKRKSVYFTWSQGLLSTAGTTSTVNELIELAGGVNSCTIAREHVIINKENLLTWNPDVMVLWPDPSRDPGMILSLPELKQINAVRNKRVYELPSVFLCDLWTLKFPYAVKKLAGWCYPDIFADLDMEEEKINMLVNLYGEKGRNLPGIN